MLREAFGKVVLNSGQSIQYGKEEESYRGAVVFQPPQGIFPRSEDEVLAVLDMSRYYPNIILGYGIDKLATKVIAALTMNRLEYEREMTKYEVDTREYEIYEAKRDETKYLLNSTYGYFAYQASRKHKREKAAKITEKARLGLYVIRDAAEKFGVRVLYGDTDSLIVQCKRSEIEELVLHLNDVILKQHCKSEGIPHILKLKCDRIADQGLFVEAKSKKKTAQKRYSLHIIWENGKDTDYVDITGFDYVRGNASKPTRKLQVTVNKMILKKNRSAIPSYIRALMKDMREEKYSYSDLAIPITLRKPLDKYLKTQPDYVRGSKWAVENLGLEIIGGDRVKMLYFKSPTDVICFFDDEDIKKLKLVLSRTVVLDMEKIIDRTIKKKAEQFLSLAGISWRDIEGSIDFEKWFNQ